VRAVRRAPVRYEDRWAEGTASLRHTVTAVIPTRGENARVRACLQGLARSVRPGARLEVVVVSNGGPVAPPPGFPHPYTCLEERRPFNWSLYNNAAAARAAGDFLLFLNDDVEPLHGGWLDVLLEAAERPGVGAVGARLLYPDGTIQHDGIGLDAGGQPRHLRRGEEPSPAEPDPVPEAAVTGACLLTPAAVWRQLSGFDPSFAYSYNDVDYCLRLRRAGFACLVVRGARLLHHESATRPLAVDPAEQRRFASRWG
jgi:GT2 family glycosyltransferase